jgi:predicted dehydrogenase
VLYEQAVHHFDLWRFLLFTEVREVHASIRSDEWEDVSAAVTARLANGAVVSALFCERTTAANELAVLGRDGRLRLSGYRFDGLRFEPALTEPGSIAARLGDAMHTLRHLPDAFSSGRRGGEYQRAFLEHWRHCCQVLRGEARQECTLEDGRRAVEVVLAAAESDRTGRPVAIGAT